MDFLAIAKMLLVRPFPTGNVVVSVIAKMLLVRDHFLDITIITYHLMVARQDFDSGNGDLESLKLIAMEKVLPRVGLR